MYPNKDVVRVASYNYVEQRFLNSKTHIPLLISIEIVYILDQKLRSFHFNQIVFILSIIIDTRYFAIVAQTFDNDLLYLFQIL